MLCCGFTLHLILPILPVCFLYFTFVLPVFYLNFCLYFTSILYVFYQSVTFILPAFNQYSNCILCFTWKRWGLPHPQVAWGVPAPCRPGWGCRWGTGVRQSDGPTWRSAWSASPAPAARFYLLFPLSQSPERSVQCQSRGYVQRYLGKYICRYVENALTKVLSRFDPTWVCRDFYAFPFPELLNWTECQPVIANSPCH